MKKEDLFESLQGIDPEFLEESERTSSTKRWKPLAAIAACLVLLIITALALPMVPQPAEPVQAQTNAEENPTDIQTEIHYNTPTADLKDDLSPLYCYVLHTERLRGKQLRGLVPDGFPARMNLSGYALFNLFTNELYAIEIEGHENSVRVYIKLIDQQSSLYDLFSQRLRGDVQRSHCGDLAFAVYEHIEGDFTYLSAYSDTDDQKLLYICVRALPSKVENAKQELKTIMEGYADCWDQIDLNSIQATDPPKKTLTLHEAQADAEFGAYILRELPPGSWTGEIKKSKWGDSLYWSLFGSWNNGEDQLLWYVDYYSEYDKIRLADISQPETYDLSLYSDSVPEELQRVVEDPIFDANELTLEAIRTRVCEDGSMVFTVRYGDILVSIDCKGVTPEWVYEQLKSLIP